jgi:hypothetical protein
MTHADDHSSSPSAGPVFRKSSFSQTAACIEVAFDGDAVLIRNSRDLPSGTLQFTQIEWEAFVSGVSNGEFEGHHA